MLTKFIIGIFGIVWMTSENIYAQQAITTSGGNASGAGGSSSYSIGQVVYSQKGASKEILEGVQIAYEIITLATSETGTSEKNISLYPNPVKDMLFVDFNQEKFAHSTYQLYDIQGKLIKNGNLSQKKNELDFTLLPSSIYLIRIYSENKMVKTFKIIKK